MFNINRTFYMMQGHGESGESSGSSEEYTESTIQKLISYIMNTPNNINPAILLQLIRDLDDDELNSLRYRSGVNSSPVDIEIPGGQKD